jgi:hypothetical protein
MRTLSILTFAINTGAKAGLAELTSMSRRSYHQYIRNSILGHQEVTPEITPNVYSCKKEEREPKGQVPRRYNNSCLECKREGKRQLNFPKAQIKKF